MKKKVVISGASGFLGRSLLIRMANDEKYQVFALSSDPESLKETILAENIAFMHKDAVVTENGKNAFAGAVLINCAYPRNTNGENVADGLRYIYELFEKAKLNGAEAIINISSQSLYSSKRTEAASEVTPACLETAYAVGKYATELLLESICNNMDIKYTNIRLASLIGPGFEQRIVNRLTKQAIEKRVITVNDNNKKFGYFDIEDAVEGIIAVLDSEEKMKWDRVYNLGGRCLYTLMDIADAIRSVIPDSIQINIIKAGSEDVFCSAVDSERFYESFNFEPDVGLTRSIEKIASYYNSK